MILSMTGFAAVAAELPGVSLAVELRSVNHRYLDVTLRLPDELRAVEPALRETLAGAVKRGKVDGMILKALEDGQIDEAELASIITAHRSHIAARHAEVSAILALHSTRQEPKP